MAEMELSVFGRSMKSNITDQPSFTVEAQALTLEGNQVDAIANWQFRNADARIKLK
jgi:phage gp16-like protein